MKKVRVVIASTNPVKIKAAVGGLQRMFPQVEFEEKSVEVPSGVADQPLSDEETLKGAKNRVSNACAAHPQADFWVGIEGGVEHLDGGLAAFAWVVIRSGDLEGKARSGAFFLPTAVQELIKKGVELGTADDIVFGRTDSKRAGGAIGLLTDNVLDRQQLYEQAVVLALVSFRNEKLYRQER